MSRWVHESGSEFAHHAGGEGLIGAHAEVFWDGDSRYFSGIVKAFSARGKGRARRQPPVERDAHRIHYEDGDTIGTRCGTDSGRGTSSGG